MHTRELESLHRKRPVDPSGHRIEGPAGLPDVDTPHLEQADVSGVLAPVPVRRVQQTREQRLTEVGVLRPQGVRHLHRPLHGVLASERPEIVGAREGEADMLVKPNVAHRVDQGVSSLIYGIAAALRCRGEALDGFGVQRIEPVMAHDLLDEIHLDRKVGTKRRRDAAVHSRRRVSLRCAAHLQALQDPDHFRLWHGHPEQALQAFVPQRDRGHLRGGPPNLTATDDHRASERGQQRQGAPRRRVEHAPVIHLPLEPMTGIRV